MSVECCLWPTAHGQEYIEAHRDAAYGVIVLRASIGARQRWRDGRTDEVYDVVTCSAVAEGSDIRSTLFVNELIDAVLAYTSSQVAESCVASTSTSALIRVVPA